MHDDVRNASDSGDTHAGPSPSGEYHFHHDSRSDGRLSTTVAHSLADVMGSDVTDTGFILFDSINPESLDRLFLPTATGGARSSGHVAFTVDGYRVTVYSDGRIVITPPAFHE
jgi:hypothetical protein